APLLADDCPMLGGRPDRNNVSPEKGLPVTFEAEKQQKNIKWMTDLGSQTWSSPVIAGGRIFIGTNNDKPRDPPITADQGVLMCFSEADGKFLWQVVHDKLPNPDWYDFPNIGVCSTPCVVGEQLFYVSNRAELICRSVQDGKQVW